MKFQFLPWKRFVKFIHSEKAAKHLVNFQKRWKFSSNYCIIMYLTQILFCLKQLSTKILNSIQIVHNEAISFMKVVFAGPAKLVSVPHYVFLSPLSHEVFKSLSLYSLCYGRLKCLKIALTSFKTKSIQVTKF